MYDYTDVKTKHTPIINRTYKRTDLVFYKSQYGRDIYKIPKYNIQLTFCKVWNKATGEFFGHNELWISFNPHKIFNDNLHNGNDFTAYNAIKIITNVFDYLDIKQCEYNEITPIAIEFGVNALIKNVIDEVNNLIDNTLYFKGSQFVWYPKDENGKRIFAKKSGTEKKKLIKIYNKSQELKDKGKDLKSIGVNENTLRFELKYFKDALKRELNIIDLNDVINPKTFEIVAKCLIDSLGFLLIIEPKPNKEFYTKKDYEYLLKRNNKEYWDRLYNLSKSERKDKDRFNYERKKYNSISKSKQLLDATIIAKILEVQISDFFTKELKEQKHPSNLDKQMDTENLENMKIPTFSPRARDKGENVGNNETERLCLVTGYNIYKQKKNSLYLNEKGVEWYYKNDPVLFNNLKNGFLPKGKFIGSIERQIYLIAHNIRNKANNPKRYYIKVSPIQLNLFV